MQEIEDAVVANLNVLVLRPELDNREARNIFDNILENKRTKDYTKIFCKSISDPEVIFELVKGYSPNLIIIDEAQFFGQSTPLVLQKILDQHGNDDNFSIVVAGLDTDFKRELFGAMHALMAIADKVIKLKAVCNRCNKKKAIFTWRKGDSSLQVIVGNTELYEARCRKCFHL